MTKVNREMQHFDELPLEGKVDVIYSVNDNRPRFLSMWDVAQQAHNELLEYHEQWAGKFIHIRLTS